MAKELMEIGGFIISGEPLVYADSATMTGQGTVSEPFGVKSTDLFVQEPLYTGTSGNSAYIGWNNETVLFSGDVSNYTALSGSITASENLKNFESIRIDYTMEKTTPGWAPIETRQFTMNQHGIADNSFYLTLNSLFAVTNNISVERFSKATINDNVLTIDFECQRVNTGALEDQAGMCHILSIVGINRKV